MPRSPKPAYRLFYREFKERILDLVAEMQPERIIEIGGGRDPLLTPEEFPPSLKSYVVIDVSQDELDRAPAGYEKVCADACTTDFPSASADLIFSRLVAEHVRDGRQFHANTFRMLKDGGTAVHLIPLLYSPPFVANKLLPEELAGRLLRLLFPNRAQKFPAYYSMCFGPSKKMLEMFAVIGYEHVDFTVYYGHHYFDRVPLIRAIDEWVSETAYRRNFFWLGSFAFVGAQRPVSRPVEAVAAEPQLQPAEARALQEA